jgi:hypothetical protein
MQRRVPLRAGSDYSSPGPIRHRRPAPPAAAAADQPEAPTDSDTPDVVTPEDTTPEVIDVGPSPLHVIEAIQNLGNGQSDFAEHMTRWAELQRDLADTMTTWASRQRECADGLERLLTSFSPRA